jgi:thymidine kinase
MASLTVITGPMFGNKTTTLICLIRGNTNISDCLVVKPSTDTRYDTYGKDDIVSHNHDSYPATSCEPGKLKDLDWQNATTIFIDEGHFFPDIVANVKKFLEAGIDVVVAGIDLDYHHKPFENMRILIDMAKTIIRCKAFCQCGEFAIYTKMREEMQTDENITVGGSEKYAPCCGHKHCEKTWI